MSDEWANQLMLNILDKRGLIGIRLASFVAASMTMGSDRKFLEGAQVKKVSAMMKDSERGSLLMKHNIGAEIHSYFDDLFGRGEWTREEMGMSG